MTRPETADQTRAHARAGDLPEFRVIAVRVPPGSEDRRTPIAIVEGDLGPVRLLMTVASRNGNRIIVLAPTAADGTPGVRLPPKVADVVTTATLRAINADLVAASVLRRKGRPPVEN
jgi:hypothetical protein